jgi:hypothetical protein
LWRESTFLTELNYLNNFLHNSPNAFNGKM